MGAPSAHTSRGQARLHAVASARERTFVDLATTGGVLRERQKGVMLLANQMFLIKVLEWRRAPESRDDVPKRRLRCSHCR